MFTGLGLVQGVPALMPDASADFSETDGALSVSSVFIQGGAILEIVVNDPDYSVTDSDISGGPEATVDGTDYDMVQGANGKWYAYVVDASVSTLLDADDDGMEYGVKCTTGLGVHTGHGGEVGNSEGTRGTMNILGDESWDVWTEATASATSALKPSGSCSGINNMIGSLDDTAGTTSRQLLSDAVLQSAPSLSNWNGVLANSTLIDLGQRGHSLNASGYGSWPYIYTFDLPADTLVEYGSDSINVEYGNTNDETSISLLNQSPGDLTHLHLSITDPALNIDPTSADTWIMNLSAPSSSDHSLIFANNVTDTVGLTGGSGAISLLKWETWNFPVTDY
jgi:hypothetical protein